MPIMDKKIEFNYGNTNRKLQLYSKNVDKIHMTITIATNGNDTQ